MRLLFFADRYIRSTLPKHLLGQGCVVEIQNLKGYKVGVAKASKHQLCLKAGVKRIGKTCIGIDEVYSGHRKGWQQALSKKKKFDWQCDGVV